MSLTREEWVEMWKTVKYIESLAINQLQGNPATRKLVLTETKKIKGWIQEVIGQME